MSWAPAPNAPRIGIVYDDRLQVPGPAHIELEAPTAGRGYRRKRCQGIFTDAAVIVLTPV